LEGLLGILLLLSSRVDSVENENKQTKTKTTVKEEGKPVKEVTRKPRREEKEPYAISRRNVEP
jgi:hypothetical protein